MNDPHPLVKVEVFNADGRLLEAHTPKRVGPDGEDIYVADGLGKLKVVIHCREMDKGEPVKGWQEWPE